MEIPADPARKQKKLTSVVWNHFERIRKGETCYAVCVHCNKKLSGSSNSGTTHLRNHLMRCLKRSNFDVSQLLVAKRRKIDNTVTLSSIGYGDEPHRKDEYVKPALVKFDHDPPKKDEIVSFGGGRKFDQDRSRSDLARMIIMHGYPLAMVDHVGFEVFVKNLQPMFEVVPSSDVQLSCMEIYQRERQKVSEKMNNFHGRINISVEKWTSQENSEYLCLTAHYVDEDWRLQKKVMSFVALDSSHTEDLLLGVIIKCLTDWDVDSKIFAFTFEDCSVDGDIVEKIKDSIGQNKAVLRRRLIDVRCALHALKSLVRDSIESLQEVIQKIRESIGFVKSSQAVLGKFNKIAQQVGVNSQRKLVLDCPGQWNTTYLMLEAAAEHRTAFSLLRDHEPSYPSTLTDTEWESVASVSGCLHIFYEVTNAVSSDKCARTANIYFPEICDVHIRMIEWCKSADDFASSVALKMKAKFDRYWSKCSLTLAMAAVLDPRFKLKLVEYYYSQIYGSTALDRIKEVSDGIKALFNTYSICSALVEEESALPGNSLSSTSNEPRDRLKGFDKFLHETSQSQNSASDLDKYLEEPVFPRNCDFNLLNWWKVHTPRYPILSMMARDILGTPMTVSPELAFSAGGRFLDQSRSSLGPETLEALICTQDWLRTEPLDLAPLAVHSARPLLIEPS